jgi:putative transposase
MSATKRRQLVMASHPGLSLTKQCELLDVSRTHMYYKPRGESALNEQLMKCIDRYFLLHPYYGVERMVDYFNKDLGYRVNEKRVRRLYKIMNLKTIYPKPITTKRDVATYKYPYLLRNLKVTQPNEVWQTDITYIPMFQGFCIWLPLSMYTAEKHWVGVFPIMTTKWCIELLEDTIKTYGKPQIHNSDQGSQYTIELYIKTLQKNEIKISMDGKGRALDNIYIERFWRSLKQEKLIESKQYGIYFSFSSKNLTLISNSFFRILTHHILDNVKLA